MSNERDKTMLNLPSLEIIRLEHQERLKEAEEWRLYRQLEGNRPGLLHHFKTAMQRMKTHSQSNLVEPCLNGS